MPKRDTHAPSDTLAGMLQRGRGEGFRRLLAAPRAEACELLVDCICHDPRLDSQCEDRSGYYANLVIRLDLDLSPLVNYLHVHDDPDDRSWNTPLTVDTLTELAKRGYRDSTEILCDYVAWGMWWENPLEDLAILPDPTILLSIAVAIEKRFPSDEALLEAMRWPYNSGKIWLALEPLSARISSVRRSLLEEKASEPKEVPTNLESLDARQLLAVAEKRNYSKIAQTLAQRVTKSDVDWLVQNVNLTDPYKSYAACAGLTRLAPAGIHEWLSAFWCDHPKMPPLVRNGMCKTMLALSPDLTLPWARKLIRSTKPHERRLAGRLLEVHATLEDLPLLVSTIAKALEDDCENCYLICNLAEAFYRFPNLGPVQELERTFVEFRYSYGRSLVAKAIQITSPERFRDAFALECLWDCEPNSRLLGAKYVALDSQEARDRLKALADNVWESEEVRTEARRRLQEG